MNRIITGDCRDVMRTLIAEGVKVQCVVTSPPYWGLRDYGVAGQLGMEPTIGEFVANMVEVFGLVRDLLADDGTLWLNLGDCYSNSDKGGYAKDRVKSMDSLQRSNLGANFIGAPNRTPQKGLKPKDLCGIPWRVAFALQADGWYLRQDIIWHKPNPMPESIKDRCTKAHEYLFLMTKSERYLCDMEAIREDSIGQNEHDLSGGGYKTTPDGQKPQSGNRKTKVPGGWDTREGAHGTIHREGRTSAEYEEIEIKAGRNKRSVWTIATSPYPEAHFATYPPALIEPCILAGSKPGDIVFDPFFGSGTTGEVAQRLGRNWLGCELNPEYVELAERRTSGTMGMAFA